MWGKDEIDVLVQLVDEPISDPEDKELEACIRGYFERDENKNMSDLEKTEAKFRVFMLTARSDDGMNVLHVACKSGSSATYFLIQQADHFGIRHLIVNVKELQGRTPLFFLCKEGGSGKAPRKSAQAVAGDGAAGE